MGNVCVKYKEHRYKVAEKKFEEKLKEYNYILENIDNQIVMKRKNLKELNQCGICFENQCNMVYVTCGHTLCNVCDETYKHQTCPYCREPISWKQKIFKI